jgi:hypothetical protein
MYDFQPIVWFIHFRGRGRRGQAGAGGPQRAESDVDAAAAVAAVEPPKTRLDVTRPKSILHGYDAEVSDNGVVTVYAARRSPVYIDGVRVNPASNIATNVSFEPLNSSGTQAAVIPDFGMVAGEVNRVVGTMQAQGFSHEFKAGNPYQLAQEVRTGLNRTNSR